ncbi:MAG: acyltransferase [Erythrobacter sp.]|nr:MAG: acyltransferase [Erythrobacter sp.]
MAASPLLRASTIHARLDDCGNRGPGFDTVRLLAASAVVLHHALGVEYDIVRNDALFAFSGGYTHTGLLAVAVFFAISGFLVTPGLVKNGDVIEYLSRRFMRIMPLLVFVVIVTALVIGPLFTTLPAGEYFARPETWLYLRNITTSLSLPLPGVIDLDGGNTINDPLWTLRYEWLCYLLVAAASLLALLRHRLAFLALWLAAMSVLAIAYGPTIADEPQGNLYVLLYLFAYFGAGALVFLFGDVIRFSRSTLLTALMLLVFALVLGAGHVFAPLLTAYVAIGIGLLRFPWTAKLARADLSYGVYLTHSVILMILVNLYPFAHWWALFALGLGCSCLVAACSWHFIEAPALRHKSWPAQAVKRLLARVPGLGDFSRHGQLLRPKVKE